MDQEEIEWLNAFRGKTLQYIRQARVPGSTIPFVRIGFTDGSNYQVHPKDDVYFEACMLNSIRKARAVKHIDFIVPDQIGESWMVEVRTNTYPLFMLMGRHSNDVSLFPFILKKEIVNVQ